MVSDGTTAQTWICPVARDAVDTDNGVESAQIIVVGPVVSCLFHSMTENGGTVEIAPPNNIIPRDGLQSTPICGQRYKHRQQGARFLPLQVQHSGGLGRRDVPLGRE